MVDRKQASTQTRATAGARLRGVLTVPVSLRHPPPAGIASADDVEPMPALIVPG